MRKTGVDIMSRHHESNNIDSVENKQFRTSFIGLIGKIPLGMILDVAI
jgi:hypothetical protein